MNRREFLTGAAVAAATAALPATAAPLVVYGESPAMSALRGLPAAGSLARTKTGLVVFDGGKWVSL